MVYEILKCILNYDLVFNDIDDFYQDYVISESIIMEKIKRLDEKVDISLCLIVKNEERCIKRFIKRNEHLFDELIILDTGSTDNTKEIVMQKVESNSKIKLHEYIWEDDFSKARNYAKGLAKNKWVLFLDADEIIESDDVKKLYKLANLFNDFVVNEPLAFIIKVCNKNLDIETPTMQRFFYNTDKINYYGKVHEYIQYEESDKNYLNCLIDVRVYHDGYDIEIKETKNKQLRNLKILTEMLKVDNNKRWLYYYTRDGINLVPDEILENMILDGLGIQDSYENINFKDDYTVELIQNLIILKIRQNKECKPLLDIFETRFKNNYDSIFYKVYFEIQKNRAIINNLLKKVIHYRKKNFGLQNSLFSNQGYHIDLLIAILLFEVGDFTRSKIYFSFLKKHIDYKGIFPDLDSLDKILFK